MWVLKQITKFPPGGFWMMDNGVKFGGSGDFPTLVHEVMSYRRANKLPKATYAEVAEEACRQICQRIGNDPRFCRESSATTVQEASPSIASPRTPCGSCGGKKKKQ